MIKHPSSANQGGGLVVVLQPKVHKTPSLRWRLHKSLGCCCHTATTFMLRQGGGYKCYSDSGWHADKHSLLLRCDFPTHFMSLKYLDYITSACIVEQYVLETALAGTMAQSSILLPSSSKKARSFNPAGCRTYKYLYVRIYVHIQSYTSTYIFYALLYIGHTYWYFNGISPFADGLHQVFGPKPLKHQHEHIDLRILTHIFSGRPRWSWCGFHLGICLDSSHHLWVCSFNGQRPGFSLRWYGCTVFRIKWYI